MRAYFVLGWLVGGETVEDVWLEVGRSVSSIGHCIRTGRPGDTDLSTCQYSFV